MQITVADYDEFIDKVFDAKGDTLDIVFSAAEYENGTFKVDCDAGLKQLKLRGQANAALASSSMSVCADRIEVEKLVFDTRRVFNAVFAARVKETITLRQCAWIRAFLSEQQGLSIIHLEPRSDSVQLMMANSWVMGNTTNAGHHILSVRSATSGAFTTMNFQQTAFIDNRADVMIAAVTGDTINLSDCFVLVRDDKTVFLGSRTANAQINFTDCTIIAPSLRQLVTQWAGNGTVRFERCRLYLSADDSVPGGIRLIDSPVKKVNALSDNDYQAWVQTVEANARKGQTPRADELTAGLKLK
jgi:hypothetical protein